MSEIPDKIKRLLEKTLSTTDPFEGNIDAVTAGILRELVTLLDTHKTLYDRIMNGRANLNDVGFLADNRLAVIRSLVELCDLFYLPLAILSTPGDVVKRQLSEYPSNHEELQRNKEGGLMKAIEAIKNDSRRQRSECIRNREELDNV